MLYWDNYKNKNNIGIGQYLNLGIRWEVKKMWIGASPRIFYVFRHNFVLEQQFKSITDLSQIKHHSVTFN